MFVLHKFLAFPVVRYNRELVGVVNVGLFTEEVFDLSEREHMESVFQTIGFPGSDSPVAERTRISS